MISQLLVISLSLVLVTGCVNRSTAPESVKVYTDTHEPPDGLALVYLIRPWAFRVSARSVPFNYNGRNVGHIGTGQYLAVYAVPQEVTFGDSGAPSSLVVNLKERHTYFIKMEYEMHINPAAPATYTLLDEVSGRALMSDFELSGSNPFSYTCGFEDLNLTKQLYAYSLEYSQESDHFIQSSACMVVAASRGQMEIVRWGNETAGMPIDNFVWGIPESPVPTTPLKAALDAENLDIASYLIDNGASFYAVGDDFRFLALNHAVDMQQIDIVRFLLERGANPNQYLEGETPLVRAVRTGQADIAKLLMDNGAFVSYFDPSLEDPLTVAREYGNSELEAMLVSAGAIDQQARARRMEEAQRAREQIDREMARREDEARKARAKQTLQEVGELAVAVVGIALGLAAIYYTAGALAPALLPSDSPSSEGSGSQPRSTKQSDVLSTGEQCSSDYACNVGYSCVKKPYSSSGVCMRKVDSYGLPTHEGPSSRSVRIKTTGDCQFSTDCPVGFICHREYKACVRR